MSPVHTVAEVFDTLQRVKAGATAFCTNFFPVQSKLQGWVDHGELQAESGEGTALFLRKNRDFRHLYFCAASPEQLRRMLSVLPERKTERLVIDLVGLGQGLGELTCELQAAGFRPYSRLQRMARAAVAGESRTDSHSVQADHATENSSPVAFAEKADRDAVLSLLEASFDHYADQLPVGHEVEAALDNRQMLAIKREKTLAALLFFETQGFTSTLRYWAVAEPFRSRRLGSVLMRYYFAAHSAVRRFILWVVATNDNAVSKYRHYGYAPDGLMDLVLVNNLIQP